MSFTHSTHAPRSHVPRIELLEARIAPATFTVTSLQDAGAGTLRDAIDQANAAGGDDTIVFAPKLKGKIKLASVLEITDGLVIDGSTAKKIEVTGNFKTQLFSIEGTDLDVSFDSIRFSKGKAESGGAVAIDNAGGSVTFSKSTFTKNLAAGTAGNADTADGGNALGGAVAIFAGDLTIQQSKITGNQAKGGNGFIETRTTYGYTFVYEGRGGDASGGAVHAAPGTSVDISGSTFAKNTATGGKGDGASAADGGALSASGDLEIAQSKFTKNRALGEFFAIGGAIHAKGRGSLESVTVSKNMAGSAPGAGGTTAFGGGISIYSGATLTIQNSTVSGNVALGASGKAGMDGNNGKKGANGENGYNGGRGESGGYGSYGYSGDDGGEGESGQDGGDAFGGGIHNAGNLTLQTSTISGNRALAGKGGAGGDGGDGGNGGKGGNGGRGGPSYRYGGYTYPAGYGGNGGDGGAGGSGGSGGNGGNGGAAQGGGVFNESVSSFISTSTISGNTVKSGKGGTAGDRGLGGAGGAGGTKGAGRAPDPSYDYNYGPANGQRGERGANGYAGVSGDAGESAGPDVHTVASVPNAEDGPIVTISPPVESDAPAAPLPDDTMRFPPTNGGTLVVNPSPDIYIPPVLLTDVILLRPGIVTTPIVYDPLAVDRPAQGTDESFILPGSTDTTSGLPPYLGIGTLGGSITYSGSIMLTGGGSFNLYDDGILLLPSV